MLRFIKLSFITLNILFLIGCSVNGNDDNNGILSSIDYSSTYEGVYLKTEGDKKILCYKNCDEEKLSHFYYKEDPKNMSIDLIFNSRQADTTKNIKWVSRESDFRVELSVELSPEGSAYISYYFAMLLFNDVKYTKNFSPFTYKIYKENDELYIKFSQFEISNDYFINNKDISNLSAKDLHLVNEKVFKYYPIDIGVFLEKKSKSS